MRNKGLNRKTGLLLAAGIGALAIGAWAAWALWDKNGVKTEHLDLAGREGRALAAAVMDQAYGSPQHDAKLNCWHYLRENGGDYCLKPLTLDRVSANGRRKLYLLASGNREGASDEDLSGLIGAFVVNADTLAPIAGSRELDFLNRRAAGPDQAQLLQLSSDGYMGWFAIGRSAGGDAPEEFPYMYAPKGDKIVEIGGDIFGPDSETAAGLKFAYQLDSGKSKAAAYPLSLTVRDGKDKELAGFDFRFDRNRWEYVCADIDCRARAGLPMRADSASRAPRPETATDANEALFGQGRKLSETDLRDVLGQLGVSYVAQNGAAGFVDQRGCDQPYPLDAHFERDGGQEQLWVRGGDSCTSGDAGSSVWVFVRDANGRLRANLGIPAAEVRRTRDMSVGVRDLRVGSANFCDRIWRWNGKAFVHLLTLPSQTGGCDSESA
ncbi:hypothetical protein [Chromobacterium sp. IIBBL 290-4]|uniref:hypothetical protein n=1 Tax=Chromobacterium sp. IIBBL 290-4 TaxID=2953890 RepID=UPI0020B68541|nr:hypothetical protein [Chromobacterium sp. IIBBL 290-4]UTH75758.1 hypothetical protein NKT35_06565 [Chromobacterium sp. IIBBL 290-4]